MIILRRNHQASYTAAPVIREADVGKYLDGERSLGSRYEQIPPRVILQRGFWLLMSRKVSTARILLISIQPPAPACEYGEPPVLIFRSPNADQCYLGVVKQGADGGLALHPQWQDDYPPLSLEGLQYIGEVVAGR